jgi:hypothetical protein
MPVPSQAGQGEKRRTAPSHAPQGRSNLRTYRLASTAYPPHPVERPSREQRQQTATLTRLPTVVISSQVWHRIGSAGSWKSRYRFSASLATLSARSEIVSLFVPGAAWGAIMIAISLARPLVRSSQQKSMES